MSSRRNDVRPPCVPGWSRIVVWALVLTSTSCTHKTHEKGHLFTDITPESGIEFSFVNGAAGARYVVETMIGGLGWIDYDGDGDYDLYVVNGHGEPGRAGEEGREGNRLYRNDGAGRFSDRTAQAEVGDRRYGNGLAVGDYDNDGHSDLLVTNVGRNTLYHNDGDGTFTDVTVRAGLVEEGYSSSAVWFDMDRDGLLDLYIAQYLTYRLRSPRRCQENGTVVYCHPKFFSGARDLLYHNRGDGTFEEVGQRAGVVRAGPYEGKGLGVVAADLDRDGFTDLYVTNDATPNFLWRARGDGTFTDVAQELGVALSAEGRPQAGMGVDVGDVNGDGLTDVYVTNFSGELNALYVGTEAGHYIEKSRSSRLGATYLPLGFGTLLLDVDLDGDQDIVTVNGHVNDLVEMTDPGTGSTYSQRASLFLNDGSGRFEAASNGGPFFHEKVVGRGLASCDFDDDGDVDLALGTLDRSVILLRNNNPGAGRSTVIRLVGTKSPRDAYGARVEVTVLGKVRVFEYSSGRSYLSACDPRLIVGLGTATKLDRIRIHWPSGQVEEHVDVAVERRLTFTEGESAE